MVKITDNDIINEPIIQFKNDILDYTQKLIKMYKICNK